MDKVVRVLLLVILAYFEYSLATLFATSLLLAFLFFFV